MKKWIFVALPAVTCLAFGSALSVSTSYAADKTSAVPVAADGISGVVTGPKGPEAGVWVIAETTDLPAKFIKIVVTDDQGRYVVPELPKGNYDVWVRGYGLVDSDHVKATPGRRLDLKAKPAPDGKAAAQFYPADSWYSLLQPPAASEFPGTGNEGNGIGPAMTSHQIWMGTMKGCIGCHQIGSKVTRELPASGNSVEAWHARIQAERPAGDFSMGNQGKGYKVFMGQVMDVLGSRGLKTFADWTDRIAAGEYPRVAPPRPTGVERNVVITQWDWGTGTMVHDEVVTDRRDPTVNAKGLAYGIETHVGKIVIMDPNTGKSEEVALPGAENSFSHSILMDEKSRVWVTDLGGIFQPDLKPELRPDYCSDSAKNKYAKYFPQPGRQTNIYVYDPATKKVTTIPTCFRTQHQWFSKDSTMYMAGDEMVGWIDTKVWDETQDPQKSTGWCPVVLNTKEGAKASPGPGEVVIQPDRAKWNVLGKSADPKKDTHMPLASYGVSVNPVDDSVWLGIATYPGAIIRFERGTNPPLTCRSEMYSAPRRADGSYIAYSAQDMGFDSKGIAWVTFTSGKIGRFDRSKCKVLSGPTATGQHCAEGWTFYDDPKSPKVTGTDANSEYYYQTFLDYFDTFGMGKDIPMVAAGNSDSILALKPDSGEFVRFRVPYPMGFYGRWLDGRIDDPKAGWKGRAVWSSSATVPTWHGEGLIDGSGPHLVKFQMRPDPLAH